MTTRFRRKPHQHFAPFGRVPFGPQRVAQELAWCRRDGLGYTASDDVSNFVLMSDDARRNGQVEAMSLLLGYAHQVARAQKIAALAVRSASVVNKPKRKRQ